MIDTVFLKNMGKAAFAFSFFIFHFSLTHAQLSGAYTIDPSKAASATNYKTFTSAIADLDSGKRYDGGTSNGKGISGAVVFNVADGIYTEKLTISFIKGTSSANTITFQSANGDSNKVILTNPANDTDGSSINFNSGTVFTLKIDSAQYITFKQITINRATPQNGQVVVLNNTKGISFFNSVLRGGDSTYHGPDDVIMLQYANSMLVFRNNSFKFGGSVIAPDSAYDTVSHGFDFENNSLSGFFLSGISLSFYDSLVISNNLINNNQGIIGIQLTNCDSGFLISRNKIILPTAIEAQVRALQVLSCIGSSRHHNMVVNNMVSMVGTYSGSYYETGLYEGTNLYSDFFFNTILVNPNPKGPSGSSSAFVSWESALSNALNNIFINETQGFSTTAIASDSICSFDYNDIYSNGPYIGCYYDSTFNTTNVKTLADWKASYHYDLHSIAVVPDFLSPTDLYATNDSLSGKGIAIKGITTDIDNKTRPNPPAIGANEIIKKSGIAPIAQNTDITLYPNPTANTLNIRSGSPIMSITIFDMTGKDVYSLTGMHAQNPFISLSRLPAGIYMIKLGLENGTYATKFVKD